MVKMVKDTYGGNLHMGRKCQRSSINSSVGKNNQYLQVYAQEDAY